MRIRMPSILIMDDKELIRLTEYWIENSDNMTEKEIDDFNKQLDKLEKPY